MTVISNKSVDLQPLKGNMFLLPYGNGYPYANDDVRVRIERLGGRTGYGAAPERPWSHSAPQSPANFVIVPSTIQKAWASLFDLRLLPDGFSEQVCGLKSSHELPAYVELSRKCNLLVDTEEWNTVLSPLIIFLDSVKMHFEKTGGPIEAYPEETLNTLWSETLQHAVDIYRDIVLPMKKMTYIPRLRLEESDPFPQGSRYHGTPWIPNSVMESRELEGLQYLFQLDCDAFPKEVLENIPEARGKLLSFFMAEGEIETSPKFFDKSEEGELRTEFRSPIETFPGMVVGWVAVPSFPDVETLENIISSSEEPAYRDLEHFFGDILGENYGDITLAPDAEGVIKKIPFADFLKNQDEENFIEELLGPEYGPLTTHSDIDETMPIPRPEVLYSIPRPEVLYCCPEADRLSGWPRFEQGDETPDGGRLLYQFSWAEGLLLLGNGNEEQRTILSNGPHYGRNHIYVMSDGSLQHGMACD